MIIESSNKETILKFPSNYNIDDLIDLIDYVKFKEITSKSVAEKKDIDALIANAKKNRFSKLKRRINL